MSEHSDTTAVDGLDTTVAEDTVATGPAVEDNTTADTGADTGDTGQAETPSRREARYRRRLRDVEAERDRLAAQVEALQRAEVERLAADMLDQPPAVWRLGLSLGDVVGEDGRVDPDRVTTAVANLKQALGVVGPDDRRRRGPYVPDAGTSVGHGAHRNAWSEAFKL